MFYVVVDGPRHEAWIVEGDDYPLGQVWEVKETLKEAEEALRDYLLCPAAEKGEYCYSHNF